MLREHRYSCIFAIRKLTNHIVRKMSSILWKVVEVLARIPIVKQMNAEVNVALIRQLSVDSRVECMSVTTVTRYNCTTHVSPFPPV